MIATLYIIVICIGIVLVLINKELRIIYETLILQAKINEDLNKRVKALEYKIDINKELNKKHRNIRIDDLPALYEPGTGRKLETGNKSNKGK